MANIYWIEDEPQQLSWLESKLARNNHNIIKLKTAAEVEERIGELMSRPGAIVLDLYLPSGDLEDLPKKIHGPDIGLWLLSRIRGKLGKDYPIAILSGNISIDIVDSLEKQGISSEATFTKPLMDPHTLIDLLESWAAKFTKDSK